MPKIRERVYFNLDELQRLETDILNRRHVERYGMIRHWCHGHVLDAACGCGYGTHMISLNPDVTYCTGIDIDADAIKFAENEYSSEKINFVCGAFNEFHAPNVDTIVSIETIEHLKTPDSLIALVKTAYPETLIVSFPSKKTTHYNKFHYHDYTTGQVLELFEPYYSLNKEIILHFETTVLILRKTS